MSDPGSVESDRATPAPIRLGGRTWLLVWCGAITVFLALGIRASLSLFQVPVLEDLQAGRSVFSLAMAVLLLLSGLTQPFIGMVCDRYGAQVALFGGTILYVGGLVLAALWATPLGLNIGLGLMVGTALAGTTFVVVTAAVGRAVPPGRQSLAFGIITAGGSFGLFAMIPLAQLLLDRLGWVDAWLALAALAAVMGLLAFGIPDRPMLARHAQSAADRTETLKRCLAQAGADRSYWLLIVGFFTCGFHVSFIGVHLPADLTDRGFDPSVGASALAVIGLCNIVGSYAAGAVGGHFRKPYVLSAIYFGRAVVVALFLLAPVTETVVLMFAGGIGLLWLATVPLTSAVLAQLYGTRYLTTLYGIVFMSHQIGSFLGSWLGGLAYDLTGSYDAMWWSAIGLALFAAAVHLPIRDRAAHATAAAPA